MNLANLVFELKAVDWESLGIQLNIPYFVLKTIDKENASSETRKLTAMLHHWLTNCATSWKRIIEALQRLGGHAKTTASIIRHTMPLGKWFLLVF